MADTTLPTLTEAASLAGVDLLLVRKDGQTSDQKLTGANLFTSIENNVDIGNLSGTALPAAVVSSSLTSVGTIATGVWSGTDVAVADGGTGASDAATARTNLGLAIGTDVQAFDADTVKKDVANVYTKQQNFGTATLTDGANIAWNLDDGQSAKVTLGGNRTLDNPTNMIDGGTYILRVIQDATGSRTLGFGTAYKWPGGTPPTLTTTANAVDILSFVSDGTNMYGVSQLAFS